jgi:hypothetical protein
MALPTIMVILTALLSAFASNNAKNIHTALFFCRYVSDLGTSWVQHLDISSYPGCGYNGHKDRVR